MPGAEDADLHATAAVRLRRTGERYTAGRRALVEALAAADRPPSIPDLLGTTPGLAQSSAYRNLAVLERAGVVRRIVTTDEFARFELAEDLTEHHHHLICSTCGGVEDFTAPPDLEKSLRHAVRDVEGEVATGQDAPHHAGLLEDREVAVRRALRDGPAAGHHLGDGERGPGGGQHVDHRLAARRVALPHRDEAAGGGVVDVGHGPDGTSRTGNQ